MFKTSSSYSHMAESPGGRLSWDEALQALGAVRAGDRPGLVVVDEFPYLIHRSRNCRPSSSGRSTTLPTATPGSGCCLWLGHVDDVHVAHGNEGPPRTGKPRRRRSTVRLSGVRQVLADQRSSCRLPRACCRGRNAGISGTPHTLSSVRGRSSRSGEDQRPDLDSDNASDRTQFEAAPHGAAKPRSSRTGSSPTTCRN